MFHSYCIRRHGSSSSILLSSTFEDAESLERVNLYMISTGPSLMPGDFLSKKMIVCCKSPNGTQIELHRRIKELWPFKSWLEQPCDCDVVGLGAVPWRGSAGCSGQDKGSRWGESCHQWCRAGDAGPGWLVDYLCQFWWAGDSFQQKMCC